jgi:hypothetical protein
MTTIPPDKSEPSRPPWQLTYATPAPGNRHHLWLFPGATSRELAAVAAELPPTVYVDHHALAPGAEAVILTFRDLPDGVTLGSAPWDVPTPDPAVATDAVTRPARQPGWVPDLRAVADPGISPYTLVAQELIAAAWDGPDRARIFDLVTRESPQTVIVEGAGRRRVRGAMKAPRT